MNVHDKAHELARSLKNCPEYVRLVEAKKILAKDGATKKMVDEFIRLQMEGEIKKMSGQSLEGEKMARIQKLMEIIRLNSQATAFLEAYMRFQVLLGDVQKIIGEAIEEGMGDIGKS